MRPLSRSLALKMNFFTANSTNRQKYDRYIRNPADKFPNSDNYQYYDDHDDDDDGDGDDDDDDDRDVIVG